MLQTDFNLALVGLLPETPLGRLVQIRSEKDPKRIQKMSSWERQQRAEWTDYKIKKEIKRQLTMTKTQLEEKRRLEDARDEAFFRAVSSICTVKNKSDN